MYGGELAPAAPSPGKEVVGATTDVTDEVANAAGQVLTPTEERESSSLMDGSFSLLGKKKKKKELLTKTKTQTQRFYKIQGCFNTVKERFKKSLKRF